MDSAAGRPLPGPEPYRSTERPLRVLWVIKGLGPGGAEQLLVSLARAHDPAAVQLEVAFVLIWKDHLVAELEAAGVTVHPLGVRRGTDPRWVARLRHVILERRPDVVHAHSPLVAVVARAIVPSRAGGRPRPRLVTTEHNAWQTFAWPTRLLNALTAPLDDATVAVSPEVARSIRPASLRRRAQVVVHGVDLGHDPGPGEREAVRSELGIGDGEVVVMTVANYRPQKAYPELLVAARAVLDRGLPVRFVAVGQGPDEASIEGLHAELGLGDRFQLLGYRRDVRRLLAGADVFTLASTFEGYPVALMEALAAGLPVVATSVGGVADAIRDGVEGRLVPPSRPALLSAAIAEVVADAELQSRFAAAARERGRLFDIATAARRLEELYAGVAPAHPDR